MRPIGHYRVVPVLPEALQPLRALALDLRFAWRHELRDLFHDLDPVAFARAGGNPVELLKAVDPERLAARAQDTDYVARIASAVEKLKEEDLNAPRLAEADYLISQGDRIGYFSAEFGLTEVLPIYSGGLGVLAGDHLKSASDLGLPLVAVGLFYRQGFFRQGLLPDGRQTERYPFIEAEDVPMDVLATPPGTAPVVKVRVQDREVYLLIRRVKVGRVTLLLLDSHISVNRPADREITGRLYGGDNEMRIQQEILLGIGGLRALDVAGLRPTVRHANEGHAAFLFLERIRQLREEEGLSFEEAREVAAAGNLFTTHTPVPAGIDLFPLELMRRYMAPYAEELGIPFEKLLGLGRQVPEDPHERFSMAVLGLRLSGHVNGVSLLHAKVSRRMWRGVFPESPLSEVPIGHVTNGVHPSTWTHPTIAELKLPEAPEQVDRLELWRRHQALRASLVNQVRAREAAARKRRGAPDSEIAAAWGLLDPNALTISFARRFATYKRAPLIFHDRARLARILAGSAGGPVQLLFAGKAHPRDDAGKELIRRVSELSRLPELVGRVVLLEDYDMQLARFLVSGSDVWLNNPRRPHEASGTSGMKAAMNGVLNLSVLDGWWDEAPRDETGFSISDTTDGRSDEEVAQALYDRLEQDVVPLFYDRASPDAVPARWVEKMAASASTLTRLFSSDRMLLDYTTRAYIPAGERSRVLSADEFAKARSLAAFKSSIGDRFSAVGFVRYKIDPPDPARVPAGESFAVEVELSLEGLSTDELAVDWFEGSVDPEGVVDAGYSTPLALVAQTDGRATYSGTVVRPEDDSRGYSIRVRPRHPDLVHPNETSLVLWAG